MQSGTTPLELLALLLFDPPEELTLYSLLALFVLASNTHQFREVSNSDHPIFLFFRFAPRPQ